MRMTSCFSLVLFGVLLLLLPIFFWNFLTVSLEKLSLSPQAAVLAAMGILVGGLINVPVHRVVREESYLVDPLSVFGLGGLFPRWQRQRSETIVAVNLGGCVFPALLAVYQFVHVMRQGLALTAALLIAVVINVVACYLVARPMPGVGIVMPALVPAFVAAATALLLAPAYAPPVAFVAGVMGPLVGADLFNLGALNRSSTGMLSIGGAGTFDGIVLSGVAAAYLA